MQLSCVWREKAAAVCSEGGGKDEEKEEKPKEVKEGQEAAQEEADKESEKISDKKGLSEVRWYFKKKSCF